MNIPISREHGVAPALMFCRVCGKDTNGLALLGDNCHEVMKEVQQATGQKEEGYKAYGQNRVPDNEPCDECKSYLDGGTILVSGDTNEYLRLTREMVDSLLYRVADAKGRVIDFDSMRGKIYQIPKAFWVADGDNIRLRDPKEWTA